MLTSDCSKLVRLLRAVVLHLPKLLACINIYQGKQVHNAVQLISAHKPQILTSAAPCILVIPAEYHCNDRVSSTTGGLDMLTLHTKALVKSTELQKQSMYISSGQECGKVGGGRGVI